MKNSLFNYYWMVLIVVFIISTPSKAQKVGPSETNKQAQLQLKAEQEKEKKKVLEEEKTKKKIADNVDTNPKYKGRVKESGPKKSKRKRKEKVIENPLQ